MPQPSPHSTLSLPERPDLRHLKDQARDILRAGQAATLSQAQLQVARLYGFPSWPRLKTHVESLLEVGQLKDAIDANDLPRVQDLMTRNPALHQAPLGYGKNGPLTWVAECRVPRAAPSPERLAMAKWMLHNGSDVHQGGDGPLMRAALADERVPMLDLLVRHGADVNALWAGHYPIICAPCEALAPQALRRLLEHGADPNRHAAKWGTPLSMVVGTYSRNAAGKHACLEVLAEFGIAMPDTPPMAVHRGRLDLLEAHLRVDPQLLSRRFPEAEIYPLSIGLNPGDGLTATPLEGTTLLHLALELDDLVTARWLLEHGADPNARASVDAEGFGGHLPLFHAVVNMGRRDDAKARLLLEHGADPGLRATLRKQLRDMGDPEKEKPHVFRDVTALQYARAYQEPRWVCEAALPLLEG